MPVDPWLHQQQAQPTDAQSEDADGGQEQHGVSGHRRATADHPPQAHHGHEAVDDAEDHTQNLSPRHEHLPQSNSPAIPWTAFPTPPTTAPAVSLTASPPRASAVPTSGPF